MSLVRACPFCGHSPVAGGVCPTCHRDPTARRRVCGACGKMTPFSEPACVACGAKHGSELPGKVAIILALFAAALAVSVLLAMVR